METLNATHNVLYEHTHTWTGRRLVNTSCLLFYFQFKDGLLFFFAAPCLIYYVGLNPTCGLALPVISGVLSKRKQRLNSLLQRLIVIHSGSLFSLINTLTAWPVVSVAYSCWSALLPPTPSPPPPLSPAGDSAQLFPLP